MTTMLKAPPVRKALREASAVKRVYLGSYMPFAGVKYYGMFDTADVVLGKTRIGPVGWHTETDPPTYDDMRVAVAA